ncbi:MAG: hypothetical protein JWN56_1518 [Sphingobacteriales bacterium]|nr:hypothetical protein [Sphingobacteriales bacterium]
MDAEVYIGQISQEEKSPFIIYSGQSCRDCEENIGIYVYPPQKVQ